MSKKAVKISNDNMTRLNRIHPVTNFLFNLLFLILALACFLPVIFLFIISITNESVIAREGYKIFVKSDEISMTAYTYLWGQRKMIATAFMNSVKITVIGTLLGVVVTTMLGYVLSRREYKMHGFYTIFIFIPMVFGGGVAASYVINTQLLNLKDTHWAIILPMAISSFNATIARTYFRTNIPDSVIESAKIDGASQMTIFFRIVAPISKPLMATLGLFLAFGYWNEWFNTSLYINDDRLKSLQAMLQSLQSNLDFLSKNPYADLEISKNAKPGEAVRMAIAFVVAVPIACTYPFFQKYFISGLTIGAVKG